MSSWFGARGAGRGAGASEAEPVAQGKPLLLIGFDEKANKWTVGQEAIAAIAGVRGPLAALAVCGRARQGKSFLLNQLLNKFTGGATSQVRAQLRACFLGWREGGGAEGETCVAAVMRRCMHGMACSMAVSAPQYCMAPPLPDAYTTETHWLALLVVG